MPKPFSETVFIPDTFNPNDEFAILAYLLRQQSNQSPALKVLVMGGLRKLVNDADGAIASGSPVTATVHINYPNYEGITVTDGNGKDHRVACNIATEVSPKVLEALQTWAEGLAATVPLGADRPLISVLQPARPA